MLYWWIDGFSNQGLYFWVQKNPWKNCVFVLSDSDLKELQQYLLKIILLSIQQPQLCSIKWDSSRNKKNGVEVD